jgi:CubicO group peptidase (beta-lactamase class C family)
MSSHATLSRTIPHALSLAAAAAACLGALGASAALAAPLPQAVPAEVGLSAARLEALDAAMQARVDGMDKAGIVVLVAKDGKVVHHKAFGMADIEGRVSMSPDSVMRLYTMTKPITSVALLTLYEQGKFQLSDPLDKYIPAMANLRVFSGVDAAGDITTEPSRRKPTIHDVFRHTGGFSYGSGTSPVDRVYQGLGLDNARASSLREMIEEKLPQAPLLYQPGEQWVYSVSHDIQAYLVEYFSGMPFDEYLDETIFRPLGMKDTFFGVSRERGARQAAVYGPDGNGKLKLVEDARGSRPAGDGDSYARFASVPFGGTGLSSTAMDYARFAQMLVNGGELDGARILGRKTVELMASNHLPPSVGMLSGRNAGSGYGLGVIVLVDPPASGTLGSVGQFGWAGAATTWVIMDPTEKMVSLLFAQHMPIDFPFAYTWQTLVYQAIE